ncbi:hypothetical protein Hsero_4116 [Herbaspirillum seropedicae SmR1]|uniref:Uncharacterized protein n=1 Tax=Herbaspirillum seropedicae (strain SmR1) TaxID=757424 RepID=D8ITF6_HERSS|nr:hypothetical protein Hsero_4116 [Herbaspirillum seropedicae SmR1]
MVDRNFLMRSPNGNTFVKKGRSGSALCFDGTESICGLQGLPRPSALLPQGIHPHRHHKGQRRRQRLPEARHLHQHKAQQHAAEPGAQTAAVDARRTVCGGAMIAHGEDMRQRHADPGHHEHALVGQGLEQVGEHVRQHQRIDHCTDDNRPHQARCMQAQQVAEEGLHVDRGQVVVGGIDAGLRDPDEEQAPEAHQLENGHHHRDLGQGAILRNAAGQVDAGCAIEQDGDQVEGHAEIEAAMIGRIFRLAETGIVEGEHHQHPYAHVIREATPPAIGRRHGRAEVQPLRLVAILAHRQHQRHQEAQQVERQQHPIELVQPVLHAAEDQRHAVEHHDERGHRIEQRGIEVMQRHRDDRPLEDGVIDRRGKEDQRGQRGAQPSEQDAREQGHREPGAHGVTADAGIDETIADDREDHPDQGVACAIGQRQRCTHDDVEDRAADGPPGHRQRQLAHARAGGQAVGGEIDFLVLCL